MAKLEKKPTTPQLDYVDQDVNSPILTFVTKCEQHIDVLESDVLSYIDTTGINVHYEGTGMTCDPYGTEEEITVDAKKYLDDNFDEVTHLYYSTVLVTIQKEAINFMQGYMSAIKRQGREVEKSDVNKMMSHVRSEYGISMEVA